MAKSPEEIAKMPLKTWSSKPANKTQAREPHTHFQPGAPKYFERPGGPRGVHALSTLDSAAGSLETVANHVAAERAWYEQTLRDLEARTLKLVEDLLTKAPMVDQAPINVMTALPAAATNILAAALPPAAPLMFGENAPDSYRLVGYGLDGMTELWLHPSDFDQLAPPLQQGNGTGGTA